METGPRESPAARVAADADVLDAGLTAVLREALAAGPFEALDADVVAALARRATRSDHDPGDVVVRAGDLGDAMYVVLAGNVQVYVEDAAGRTRVLAKLGPGAFFGEQALLPGRDGRRNASVRAHSAAVLGRIDRAALEHALDGAGEITDRLRARGEAQRALLARHLAEEAGLVLDLAEHLALEPGVERALRDGEAVFRQGDAARDVYLLLRGVVAVYDEAPGAPGATGATGATGARRLLRRLRAGQCFGELGLLRRQPRSATVVAEGDAAVLAIDGARFAALWEQSPALRRALETVARTYQIPGRGIATQFTGWLAGEACLTTLYELGDGRKVVASLAFERDACRVEARDARRKPGTYASTCHAWRDATGDAEREVTVDDAGVVTALASLGPWPELPALHGLVLEGAPLPPGALADFTATGAVALRAEPAPTPGADLVRCRCTGVRQSAIGRAVAEGCATVAALRARLGCGSVCGACVPTLQEILGEEVWTPVDLVAELPLAPEVRAFRLRPRKGAARDFKPGQHVVLQARIDGALVERAYTLTSPAGEPGYYEVAVKREPRGLFSRWLFDGGARGAELRLAGPRGDVAWDGGSRPAVCVVAGIGVTPAVAIWRAHARGGKARGGDGRGVAAPLHVHYSARDRASAPYADELLAATAHPGVSVVLRETSREGRLGRADLAELARARPEADWFLCGPDAFLDEVAAGLAGLGVAAERVHLERFVHAGDPPALAAPDPAAAADVLAVPLGPPPGRLRRAARALTAHALDRLGTGPAVAAAGGPLRPRPGPIERALVRSAGLDPALPTARGTLPGLVALGPLDTTLRLFAGAAPYLANRDLARAARARGAPLPADTPDGDTVVEALPVPALTAFPGPHGVDTGWTRAADGPLLPLYVTRAPAAIRVLLGEASAIDRSPLPYHYIQQVLGIPRGCPREGGPSGLFAGCLHGNATWTRDRATARDHLAAEELERAAPALSGALRDIAAALDDAIARAPERVYDLGALTRNVTFRLAVRVLFGRVDDRAFGRLGRELIDTAIAGFTEVTLQSVGVPGRRRAFERQVASLRATGAQMVDFVRAQAAAGALTASQRRLPLVRRILEAPGGAPVPHARLTILVLPLVVGGHETSGHALAWALYHLARDPALARRVRAEMAEYRAWRDGGAFRLQDYDRRPVMQACFYEVQRRYPVLAMAPRTTKEAGVIPPDPATGIGGFRYPRNATFFVAYGGANMDPLTYPDPRAFRIDRFLDGIPEAMPVEARGRAVRARAWELEAAGRFLAFGAGPGACPGRGLAMYEFFLVLDHLFGRFDFELLDPTREVRESGDALTAPEAGALGARIRRRPAG